MKDSKYPHEKELALYQKLVLSVSGIEIKGASMPYTSVNGNMFSSLDEEGNLRVRLSKEDREKFMKKYDAQLAVAFGVVLKEYVAAPAALLKKTKELATWFQLSVDYANSLKPKPTRKSK